MGFAKQPKGRNGGSGRSGGGRDGRTAQAAQPKPWQELGLFVTEQDGKWWVTGQTKPAARQLRAMGGEWVAKREAWTFSSDPAKLPVPTAEQMEAAAPKDPTPEQMAVMGAAHEVVGILASYEEDERPSRSKPGTSYVLGIARLRVYKPNPKGDGERPLYDDYEVSALDEPVRQALAALPRGALVAVQGEINARRASGSDDGEKRIFYSLQATDPAAISVRDQAA